MAYSHSLFSWFIASYIISYPGNSQRCYAILCTLIGVARIFDWGGPNPQKFGCLHRNWEWFFSRNRKFERFFRPKSSDLQKKKKKKRSSPKLRKVFRPKPLALLLLYCLITVMCAITEKKLQLNIVRLCCHNFLSLVEFWLGGARAPWAPPWLRLCAGLYL